MTKNDPRKALGKGLHSLLPSRPAPGTTVLMVPIDDVEANINQPRQDFDAEAMQELTRSVEQDGIIQPIIARQLAPNAYQIIAGERRWRAARNAGLKEVPIIVRTADDQKVLELAIIENIQREDLNPMELAHAFQRMASELNLSQDQIGEKTGKDRATIANTIRLLQLPEEIQTMISAKKLSSGHARALLKLNNATEQRNVADRTIREGWSVRQLEEFTKPQKPSAEPVERAKPEPQRLDPNVKAAASELERVLGTRVRIIEKGKSKGQIEIEYYSDEDLDRIYNVIAGS